MPLLRFPNATVSLFDGAQQAQLVTARDPSRDLRPQAQPL
jgi:hypothetical protein